MDGGVPAGDMHPPGVPAQLTSLIGREQDLDELAASLAGTRLLTLTGAGGVGKTRLAVAATARVAADFPDGAWWVELATVTDAGAVAPTLAQALGVRALPGLSELDAVVGYLWERRALLVLDNCEHVARRGGPRRRGAAARVPVAHDPGDQSRPARDSRGDALGGSTALAADRRRSGGPAGFTCRPPVHRPRVPGRPPLVARRRGRGGDR